jgi:hypothetical protein
MPLIIKEDVHYKLHHLFLKKKERPISFLASSYILFGTTKKKKKRNKEKKMIFFLVVEKQKNQNK